MQQNVMVKVFSTRFHQILPGNLPLIVSSFTLQCQYKAHILHCKDFYVYRLTKEVFGL